MDVIDANNFNLYIYLDIQGTSVPILFCDAANLSIQIDRETLEACPNFTDGVLWRQYYYGIGGYSISIDGNLIPITAKDMAQILVGDDSVVIGADGQPISFGNTYRPTSYRYSDLEDALLYAQFLEWKATDLKTVEYSGKILVSSSTITANVNEIVKFSTSLQGTGKLNKVKL